MWTTGKIKDICDWIEDYPGPEPDVGESLISTGKTLVAAVPLIVLAVGSIFESAGRWIYSKF